MPAHKPEECDILIEKALKSRDLDAAVALYEPNATLVLDSGEVVSGKSAIREALTGFLAFDEVHFTREITAIQSGDGDLALLRGAWSATPVRPWILQRVWMSSPCDREFASAIWQGGPVRCLRPARLECSTGYSATWATSAVPPSESPSHPRLVGSTQRGSPVGRHTW